jgi:hypothetical protein
MASFTPNYDLEKPVVGGDLDVWGGKLNTNFDKVDTAIKARADATTTVATNLATLDAAVVKKDGTVAMSGPLVLPAGNPTLGTHATNKTYVDNGLSSKAPLSSPELTGTPTSPTATDGTNTTQIATTQFVTTAVANGISPLAPKASPALTGTPTSPTAGAGTNNTQIATTAFVTTAINNSGWKIGAYRTSDLSRASSATLANDGVLVFTPPANRNCLVRAHLYATGGTGGIKAALSGTTAANQVSQATLATVNGTITVIGFFASSASPGQVNLQWSQNTSNSTATILRAASFIEYMPL